MGEVEEGRSSQIPGFNRQFFGPMKDTREMVEVKDTTQEVFASAMINYVNRAPGASI